jgi:hypothetical protein
MSSSKKENVPVSKPAIVGVGPDPFGDLDSFKSVEQVPWDVEILHPIVVRGELRWQPKETPEERAERVKTAVDKDTQLKAKKVVSKWKREGKLKEITSYFCKIKK